jgi:hypothetical protein
MFGLIFTRNYKMKKFFIALEEQVEKIIDPELITEENENDITDIGSEAEELISDIDEDIEGIDRAEDVTEALETLCDVIRRIDSPTPVNVALIKVAANMAVAGTSVPAGALFSANEDFHDLKITVEGIQDKITSSLSAIAESIKNIVSKVSLFFKSVFSSYTRYSEKLKSLKAKLEEVKKSKTAKSVTVTMTGGRFFKYDGNKVIGSAAEFLTVFKDSSKVVNSFADIFGSQAKDTMSTIQGLYKNILASKEKSDKNVIEVFKKFDGFFGKLKSLPTMNLASNSRDSDIQIYESAPGMGGVSIVVELPKEGFDKENIKEIKSAISSYYLSTSSTDNVKDAFKKSEKITFENVDLVYVGTLLTQCEKNLEASKVYSSMLFKINTWNATNEFGRINNRYDPNLVKTISDYLSINIKMARAMSMSIAYMGKASWRNANGTISTALKVAETILSSKDWSAQATA